MTARRVRHANQPELVAAVPVARWAASGDAGQRVLSRKDPRVSALVATGTGAARTEYGADQHRRMHVSRTEAARSTLQSTPGRCSASITCAAPRRPSESGRPPATRWSGPVPRRAGTPYQPRGVPARRCSGGQRPRALVARRRVTRCRPRCAAAAVEAKAGRWRPARGSRTDARASGPTSRDTS